jgi:hypothetical protein
VAEGEADGIHRDRWYDAGPDGQRFLMLKTEDSHHVVRIENWLEEF